MITIDARSGDVLQPGSILRTQTHELDGSITKHWTRIMSIKPGIFSAKAQYINDYLERAGKGPQWVPLTVRYLHPGFMFQHVAFFPS